MTFICLMIASNEIQYNNCAKANTINHKYPSDQEAQKKS